MLGKTEGGREGMTEDEMAGWHHLLSGHEFKQTPICLGWESDVLKSD